MLDQNGSSRGEDAAQAATPDRRHLLQSSLQALERMKARMEAAENALLEPIAIVGIGCRLPGGIADVGAYWKLLVEGRDAVGEVPADRWDVESYYDPDPNVLGKARTKAGGFLDDVDGFEPSFFGMSPREATGVDPQQRLLLETAWEALEDAAIPPDGLDGSSTGVFVGITSHDYSTRIDVSDPKRSDVYLATGTALNAAAGRVSFTLGLQGPCMAIDTACSSSLVAIHTGCQSLRTGESDLVLAGGVNVMLSPDPYVLISKWGMLSPDGRCKTFDASANGFVRGEGCALVVLERLSDAQAKGRRILAVIRGSAINQDGRSSGLTVPNGLAQQAVVRKALRAARVTPAEVSYVEAHGTGTSLGDPIEVEALAAVYGEGRDRSQPFEIGSVKSNIGHLEAASGVAGVIKLVLSLQNRKLPATLHVREPTPAIPWADLPVRISTALHDWNPATKTRLAGISAFGFSGMNAHLIVGEAPPVIAVTPPERALHALTLSGHTEAGLKDLADRYARHLDENPDQDLEDVCRTAALGRAHLEHRLVVLGATRADLSAQLRGFAAGEPTGIRGTRSGMRMRKAFLFTGQGSQYARMGAELFEQQPVFRESIRKSAEVLDSLLGLSLESLLFGEAGELIDQTRYTQPALFALELALVAQWRHWGIEPNVLIGHSVGDFAAAVTAGVLTLEDGARLIAARGRLMQALPAGGGMTAVQGDESVIEEIARAQGLSIAARNAPGSIVLSGSLEALQTAAAELIARGLRAQPLTVSHAFHSALMDPMLEEFRRVAASVAYAPPKLPWISNLDGELFSWERWGSRMPEYWARHLREPVAFASGMRALASLGVDACIEIGPHPVLAGLGRLSVENAERIVWLPSLRRQGNAARLLLESLSALHVRGAHVAWSAIYPPAGRQSVALPTYPFQRQPYLVPPMDTRARRAAAPAVHELLGSRIAAAGVGGLFERTLTATDPPWLADHRVGGLVIMPMTGYVEATLAAAQIVLGVAHTIESIEVREPLVLNDDESRDLQTLVDEPVDGRARIRVFSRSSGDVDATWELHASAIGVAGEAPEQADPADAGSVIDAEAIDLADMYARIGKLGIDFGPKFRALQSLRRGEGGTVGEVVVDESIVHPATRFPPCSLDGCFQVAAGNFALDESLGSFTYLPVSIDRYVWRASPRGSVTGRARVRPGVRGSDTVIFDVSIASSAGEEIARLEGVHCRRASRRLLRRGSERRVEQWLQHVEWPERALHPERSALSGRWLVLDDGGLAGERLSAELQRAGASVERLLFDASSDLERRLSAESPALDGIVSLWPLALDTPTSAVPPSAGQAKGTEALLRTLKAATNLPATPRIVVVTAGAHAVGPSDTPRPEQAAVGGLARVAMQEHPDLQLIHVDLDPEHHGLDVDLVVNELRSDGVETQIAYRKGQRRVARLAAGAKLPAVKEEVVRLAINERGTLENLRLVPTDRRTPGPGEIEIRVRASGVNFRDVLSALGMYPGELRLLGSDCAGEIVALGKDVPAHFSIGDRVVAMAEGSFASHATTRWEFVAPLPSTLDFEDGAAIPTAYLTAYITLLEIAGMKRGDRVLIHSGAGGVGMAAIALASRAGAEIFATAGSREKREAILQLGVHHALDSRSTSFADDILRITKGKGVDIVLNSLAGDLLARSFDVLRDGGTFLEIGKRGVWTHEQVASLGRNHGYHVVDCNDNARDTPEIVGRIFKEVLDDIAAQRLPALRRMTFPFTQPAEAFRYMAQAKHIGRIVFRHPVAPQPAIELRANATYLVTGGTRGLGLLAAQWLAGEGARTLALVGRSEPDAASTEAIEALRAQGCDVCVVQADLGEPGSVDRVIDRLRDRPPIRGVLHCAGLLDDGMLASLTAERLGKVMRPKADAAWAIHQAFGPESQLDFLVFYSSLSAVFGSPGQGNYVAANAFLDALAERRVAQGLPALSIGWGAWSDVGMAARGDVAARASAKGMRALSPSEGLLALEVLVNGGATRAGVAPSDWCVVGAQFAGRRTPPLLEDIVAQKRTKSSASTESVQRLAKELESLSPELLSDRLLALVRRETAVVLGLDPASNSISLDQTFPGLGLDSLTSVELRNRLQNVIGRQIAATAIFEHPTVTGLSAFLGGLFAGSNGAAPAEEEREEVVI